jgi:ABC-type amino acid transport substrate-binding protein
MLESGVCCIVRTLSEKIAGDFKNGITAANHTQSGIMMHSFIGIVACLKVFMCFLYSRQNRLDRWLRISLCLLLWATADVSLGQTSGVEARVRTSGQLRVCIWPDFYGVSFRNPHTKTLSGIDIELSQAFAHDLGVDVVYIDSSFFALAEDVLTERCDVAMFAIGTRSQRSNQLALSASYMQSRVYALTNKSQQRIQTWGDIDQEGVVVGVQGGTFLERLMRESLKRATLFVVGPPTNREKELQSGRIDVFISDYPNSRRLLDRNDSFRLIEPEVNGVTLPYAYAVKPGDAAWLGRLNEFVAAIKKDGRLKQASQNHDLLPIILN